MELPKETIERIQAEAGMYSNNWQLYSDASQAIATKSYDAGAQSEALRSLSEIEKLKEENRKLSEGLNFASSVIETLEIYENAYAPEHGRNPSIESLLKSLPNKEA